MKMWKKRLAQGLLVVMVGGRILGNSIAIRAAWQSEGKDWYYYQDDGRKFTGWLSLPPEDWYYLGADGKMLTGWYQDTDGSWYYLTREGEGIEGRMKSGWYLAPDGVWYFLDTRHEGFFGRALTNGWQWIDGYCYYFHENGAMHSGGITPDGYSVNALGQWTENGMAQFILGKGIITKKAKITNQSTGSSRSSGSYGSSGSSGGSGSSSGSNVPAEGDDKSNSYRVYEESNTTVFPTQESVKGFANKTEQDKEELKKLADGMVDYWIDGDAPEVLSESQVDAQFQSVQQLHLVVEETNPLYELIQGGKIVENDVVMIPSCEYFPTGLSVVYKGNDDNYGGKNLNNYDPGSCQVIHVVEATFEDIFQEEAEYHAGGVNASEPVEFIWLPSISQDQLQSRILWEPEAVDLEQEDVDIQTETSDMENRETAASSVAAGSMENWETATPSVAARSIENWETATPSVAARSIENWETATPSKAARSLENDGEALSYTRSRASKNAFSFSQSNGEKGTNILFQANDIVLYDGDGDYLTKNDQIVINGKIGLENVNPEFGFIWEPGGADRMPKQMKTVVSYDQIMQLRVSCKDSLKMSKFIEKVHQAIDMPENKKHFLGIELQGVDWDNTVVLACVGINIGLNHVEYRMKDIQGSTNL